MSGAKVVAQWVEETKAKTGQAVRAIALEVFSRVVLRSPVGNPELWAANAHALSSRHDALAAARASGKRISRKRVETQFPLTTGKGYVGGRFRGNWQVTIGDSADSAINRVDPSGSETLQDGSAVISGVVPGMTICITNNVPYSERLEQGWSKQAPAGVVGVTAAEFDDIVAAATADLIK